MDNSIGTFTTAQLGARSSECAIPRNAGPEGAWVT
jgi:hypothetical protein